MFKLTLTLPDFLAGGDNHGRKLKTKSEVDALSAELLSGYTWDAVTSVNLNISMVRELQRHLVCTTDSLHEQQWWILMH